MSAGASTWAAVGSLLLIDCGNDEPQPTTWIEFAWRFRVGVFVLLFIAVAALASRIEGK